jgi:hypothetical protein
MKCRWQGFLIAILASIGQPSVAWAGMPLLTLTDIARARVQAISFFLVCFLACAWVVQRIWNSFRGDFPRLPCLGFGRAVGVVTLWGLLFLLVLTMISGARELMTPGAWRKEGFTYKLEDAPKPPPDPDHEPERRRSLDRLLSALWTYARGHDGRFPPDDKTPEVPEEVWRVPDPSGMRYIYKGGQTVDRGSSPLAFEPGIFGKDRLVLLTSGEIRRMSLGEIRGNSSPGAPR